MKNQKAITSQPLPTSQDIVSRRWQESSPDPSEWTSTEKRRASTWAEYLQPSDPWQQAAMASKPGHPGPGHPGPGHPGPGHPGPGHSRPGHPDSLGSPGPYTTRGNWKEPSNSSNGWMSMIPTPMDPSLPAALRHLATLDQLRIHQKLECCEICTGCETQNRYQVMTPNEHEVFYAKEKSGCCVRNCCGPIRPFEMKIMDNDQAEVIHLNRPLNCQSCCCPCCLQTMEVTTPGGTRLGLIEQEWSLFCPRYRVKNAAGDVVFKIKGPFWLASCGCEIPFKIMAIDGRTQLGQISQAMERLLQRVVHQS